jgi:5-methylcytosine-specific restriction endonuclease McrA
MRASTITEHAKRDYKRRASNLKDLGFDSYRQYLESPLWASIRSEVLARDKKKCVKCGGRATQVHHMSYGPKVLSGERIGRLVSVCASCHRAAEFDDDTKVSVREASRRLSAMPDNGRRTRSRRRANPDWEWFKGLEREARRKKAQ